MATTLIHTSEVVNAVWLAVMGPEDYRICAERGLWGVERMTRAIGELKPGDLIISYVRGEREVRDVWVVETGA